VETAASQDTRVPLAATQQRRHGSTWPAKLAPFFAAANINETVVFTTRRMVKRRVDAQGVIFLLHHIPVKRLFGLITLWRGSTRVAISDAARTLVDMIAMPETGGGIDHVAECLSSYLGSQKGDRDLLIRYTEQFGNGAVFKRLGFLAETALNDQELVAACRARLTQGYARLDPAQPCSKLVTAWHLWVPARWKQHTI
jgi:predicted transcriptional regulator of viral defense system